MKFLTGVAIGGAIGYVLGAAAGREQYERIVAMAEEAMGEGTIGNIKSKLGTTIDLAGQAIRDAAAE